MPDPHTIPQSMIEAAARVIAAPGSFDDPPVPPSGVEGYRDTYRTYARLALAAALSTCTVREEWRAKIVYETGQEGWQSFRVSRTQAEDDAAWLLSRAPDSNVCVERRLVIETPAEES